MVGTLLLGGKTRAELYASSAEGAVAARGAQPRIQVARLPQQADRPDAEASH
jgi:hypothetical protein